MQRHRASSTQQGYEASQSQRRESDLKLSSTGVLSWSDKEEQTRWCDQEGRLLRVMSRVERRATRFVFLGWEVEEHRMGADVG